MPDRLRRAGRARRVLARLPLPGWRRAVAWRASPGGYPLETPSRGYAPEPIMAGAQPVDSASNGRADQSTYLPGLGWAHIVAMYRLDTSVRDIARQSTI